MQKENLCCTRKGCVFGRDVFWAGMVLISWIFLGITTLRVEASQVWFVRDNPENSGDGLSWNSPITLQEALARANKGDQVWVAQGTYKPTQERQRQATFSLSRGIFLYGGFAPDLEGTEGDITSRDIQNHRTVLTGDLKGNDVFDAQKHDYKNGSGNDNTFHVVTVKDLTAPARLDGFIVTGGNANTSAILHGGGLYVENTGPYLTVAHCTFTRNLGGFGFSQGGYGGALYNQDSSPRVVRCTFSQNRAGLGGSSGGSGGAMGNIESNPLVIYCTFIRNKAGQGNTLGGSGGAMFNGKSSNPRIVHCTFTQNETGKGNIHGLGGGMYNDTGSDPWVANSIFWGNTKKEGSLVSEIENGKGNPRVAFCTIQEGYPKGEEIMEDDPGLGILADHGGPTWTCPISQKSSAVNTGNLEKALEILTDDGLTEKRAREILLSDQRGYLRRDHHIDMGAYEFGALPRTTPNPTPAATPSPSPRISPNPVPHTPTPLKASPTKSQAPSPTSPPRLPTTSPPEERIPKAPEGGCLVHGLSLWSMVLLGGAPFMLRRK